MDKLTEHRPFEDGYVRPRAQTGRSTAKRIVLVAFATSALVAMLGVGYRLGHSNQTLPGWVPLRVAALLGSQPAKPVEAATPTQDANSGAKRILFYRNPMGLPDTSPVPKKDSMGMDYIPVYEG